MFRHNSYHRTVDRDDFPLKIDQLALRDFDVVAGRERVRQRLIFLDDGKLQIDSFRLFLEAFQFGERRFYAVDNNGTEREVFVQETLSAVTVPLEDQKVTIRSYLAAD